jgi:hypothetical protein
MVTIAIGGNASVLVELDANSLHTTFLARPSGTRFAQLPENEQWAVVEMNRLYGEWLCIHAEAAGEPWVTSRPWHSLVDRSLDALRL